MQVYTIYMARNVINSKVYIGFDSNWPARHKAHIRDYTKDAQGRKFYYALRKYTPENFEWSILYQSKDRDHTLDTMEAFFITEYDSYRNGYNMTLGGQGTFGFHFKHKEETKRKLSKKLKGRPGKPCSPEAKVKISQAKMGTTPWNAGKTGYLSDEALNNISIANSVQVKCPHCGFVCNKSNAHKWHFDNCEKSPVFDLVARQEKLMIGRVCRISDHKEMDAGNWAKFIKHGCEAAIFDIQIPDGSVHKYTFEEFTKTYGLSKYKLRTGKYGYKILKKNGVDYGIF